MPPAGVSSIDKGLEVNKDGTVDLYMGPGGAERQGRQLDTDSQGKTVLYDIPFLRRDNAIFTKTWQLNDLELVK
jgi:hypothetical protein